MFAAAGTFKCIIDDVKFAEPKFAEGANDFDICIHVTHVTESGQSDWWRGEVSQNYGKGNFASMTQAQITLKTLHNIGFEGEDLTTLAEQVMGKEIPVTTHVKEGKDGKQFVNIHYIGAGGGDQPKVLEADEMKRRLSAMFGAGADAGTAAPKPAGNPFAGKPGAATTGLAGASKPNPFAKK